MYTYIYIHMKDSLSLPMYIYIFFLIFFWAVCNCRLPAGWPFKGCTVAVEKGESRGSYGALENALCTDPVLISNVSSFFFLYSWGGGPRKGGNGGKLQGSLQLPCFCFPAGQRVWPRALTLYEDIYIYINIYHIYHIYIYIYTLYIYIYVYVVESTV